MTFPQNILSFPGMTQRSETPRLPFCSFTPAAISDRCRREAAKRRSWGFRSLLDSSKSQYIIRKSNWKVTKFYWWISVWTMCFACLIEEMGWCQLGHNPFLEAIITDLPVNMPLCASTGPVLVWRRQHQPSTSLVLAHYRAVTLAHRIIWSSLVRKVGSKLYPVYDSRTRLHL